MRCGGGSPAPETDREGVIAGSPHRIQRYEPVKSRVVRSRSWSRRPLQHLPSELNGRVSEPVSTFPCRPVVQEVCTQCSAKKHSAFGRWKARDDQPGVILVLDLGRAYCLKVPVKTEKAMNVSLA